MDRRDRETRDDGQPIGNGPDAAANQHDPSRASRRRRRNRRGDASDPAPAPGPKTDGAVRMPERIDRDAVDGAERPIPSGGPKRPAPTRPDPDERPQGRPAPPVRTGTPYIETLGGRGLSGSGRAPNANGEVPIRPDNRTLPETPARQVCVARQALLPEDHPIQYRPYLASRRLDVVTRRDDGSLLLCDGSHSGSHRWPDQWPERHPSVDADDRTADEGRDPA